MSAFKPYQYNPTATAFGPSSVPARAAPVARGQARLVGYTKTGTVAGDLVTTIWRRFPELQSYFRWNITGRSQTSMAFVVLVTEGASADDDNAITMVGVVHNIPVTRLVMSAGVYDELLRSGLKVHSADTLVDGQRAILANLARGGLKVPDSPPVSAIPISKAQATRPMPMPMARPSAPLKSRPRPAPVVQSHKPSFVFGTGAGAPTARTGTELPPRCVSPPVHELCEEDFDSDSESETETEKAPAPVPKSQESIWSGPYNFMRNAASAAAEVFHHTMPEAPHVSDCSDDDDESEDYESEEEEEPAPAPVPEPRVTRSRAAAAAQAPVTKSVAKSAAPKKTKTPKERGRCVPTKSDHQCGWPVNNGHSLCKNPNRHTCPHHKQRWEEMERPIGKLITRGIRMVAGVEPEDEPAAPVAAPKKTTKTKAPAKERCKGITKSNKRCTLSINCPHHREANRA